MDPILDLQVLQYLPRLKWLRFVLCGSISSQQTLNLGFPSSLEYLDASCPRWECPSLANFSKLNKELLVESLGNAVTLHTLYMDSLSLDNEDILTTIANLCSLSDVRLIRCQLSSLPKGPWIRSLQKLFLAENCFAEIPPVLFECKGTLQRLDLEEAVKHVLHLPYHLPCHVDGKEKRAMRRNQDKAEAAFTAAYAELEAAGILVQPSLQDLLLSISGEG